jgi:hypothetical protein
MIADFLKKAQQGIIDIQTHKAEKYLERRYSNWWPVTDEEWDELNKKS